MPFAFQSRPDSTAITVSNVPEIEVIKLPTCEESKNKIIKTITEAVK
jgi:hypothetical protein